MAKPRNTKENAKPSRPPATTPEGRESQLVAAAVDLAAKQIADGTASSQVITHYLKLGSPREKLEREKIALENRVLAANEEQLASQKRVEELYASALTAMKSYSGEEIVDEFED